MTSQHIIIIAIIQQKAIRIKLSLALTCFVSAAAGTLYQ